MLTSEIPLGKLSLSYLIIPLRCKANLVYSSGESLAVTFQWRLPTHPLLNKPATLLPSGVGGEDGHGEGEDMRNYGHEKKRPMF